MTVREQGLAGAADEVVFGACIAEGRTLVTLDRDFGQVLRFPPIRLRVLLFWNLAVGPLSAVSSIASKVSLPSLRLVRSPVNFGLSSPDA
jgi:hypothetical protein